MTRRLRSGFTTGACAAAAAKAAVIYGLTGDCPKDVEIPFPDGSRHAFAVNSYRTEKKETTGPHYFASVIKDAGDDPDVTNGAEIFAAIRFIEVGRQKSHDCVYIAQEKISLCRGKGVGWVSKPGLAVVQGEPAINPMPRRMICSAVREGLINKKQGVEITISIPNGEILAEKTLNRRLGILGGLSILGTTGIVKPVSAESWTATIKASLNVARVAGLEEIVLSTGRTSEKGVQLLLNLPEEAYAMMGDYLNFSLKEAAAAGFKKIHLAAMWAKIIKAAMEIPQTHVRHGVIEVENALELLKSLGATDIIIEKLADANTAREILIRLNNDGHINLIESVCRKAKTYCEKVTGTKVDVYLVNSDSRVSVHV